MYHYTNEYIQPMYHNEYQPCSYIDTRNSHNPVIHNETRQVDAVIPQIVPPATLEVVDKSSTQVPKATKSIKSNKSLPCKGVIDTSSFTIEERLVAAVWVHERKRTRCSMTQINRDFKRRFGREAPAKNTLLVWERKLFSTGSVHDAPRTGRPTNRRAHMERVAASVHSQPSLSLRARATILRMPRTTLRTILHRDLAHETAGSGDTNDKSKPKSKTKKSQRQSRPRRAPPPARPAPPLAPPPARPPPPTPYL